MKVPRQGRRHVVSLLKVYIALMTLVYCNQLAKREKCKSPQCDKKVKKGYRP